MSQYDLKLKQQFLLYFCKFILHYGRGRNFPFKGRSTESPNRFPLICGHFDHSESFGPKCITRVDQRPIIHDFQSYGREGPNSPW